MNAFSPKVLEHFRDPRRAGLFDGEGLIVGNGASGHVKSGIRVRFRIGLDGSGRIARAGWECFGCPAAIASSDWVAEYCEGRSPEELSAPLPPLVAEALDLEPALLSRVLVVEDALRAALDDATSSRMCEKR
ncbi:MAG: iron-sulfur cluster assembly scaffold protein [Ectothiorhodospiraceae bacterium]|nr:iron-sulfur cluster assembly scaffold protein [Ectothiorhodospiraceae bacterium]MCH8507126.1 iron-sulfur cluster assembly scaffold protein [Ectothiorhodospiraceae bacterium]